MALQRQRIMPGTGTFMPSKSRRHHFSISFPLWMGALAEGMTMEAIGIAGGGYKRPNRLPGAPALRPGRSFRGVPGQYYGAKRVAASAHHADAGMVALHQPAPPFP